MRSFPLTECLISQTTIACRTSCLSLKRHSVGDHLLVLVYHINCLKVGLFTEPIASVQTDRLQTYGSATSCYPRIRCYYSTYGPYTKTSSGTQIPLRSILTALNTGRLSRLNTLTALIPRNAIIMHTASPDHLRCLLLAHADYRLQEMVDAFVPVYISPSEISSMWPRRCSGLLILSRLSTKPQESP